jgi:peptidyl-prolyl cis-trans isomerase C
MSRSRPRGGHSLLLHARYVATAFTWALFASVANAANPTTSTDPSPYIAESPKARITLADYEAEMAKLPPGQRQQFAATRGRLVTLLNTMYLSRAIANEARAAGLDRDPILQKQIEIMVDKFLAQAWTERVDAKVAATFDADVEKYLPRAREIYLTSPEKYTTPERVRANQVFIKVGPDGDAAAKAKAEAVRAKAVAGTPISDLAREYSDDPSAKKNGGDLGFLAAKDIDASFAEVAFAMTKPGEISPVIKTRQGYHVLEFVARQPAALRPFDTVKGSILAEIRQTLITTSRTEYQGSMFADPAPKVNEELITKINMDAQASAGPSDPTPPPPPARKSKR